MRLFSLEYYRQIINSDEVNFVKAKKKAQLKIKDQLGPFICNIKEAGKDADLILQRLKLNKASYGDTIPWISSAKEGRKGRWLPIFIIASLR